MTTALLPIHPRHVRSILAGRKKVEFRRRTPSRDVSSLLIYETAPTSKIVAVAHVERIVSGPVEDLVDEFRHAAGVTVQELVRYLTGGSSACAVVLGLVKRVKPCDYFSAGLTAPPQSWCYVGEDYLKEILAASRSRQ